MTTKCPYYRLNSTSKGGGDFNTVPEGRNYGDYLYWDGAQWMVGSNTVHLGANAGRPVQGSYAVAVGQEAGTNGQKSYAIAIGYNAGSQLQSASAISIGQEAGRYQQEVAAIAIGQQSGYNMQQTSAIAIGQQSGYNYQGINAISLGQSTGYEHQGQNAIAIGQNAGTTYQSNNSIILNASSSVTVNAGNTGLFINPIRGPFATSNVLSYDLSTKEVVYNGSSQRYKHDIKPLGENTENIYKLQPRKFKYNQNGEEDIGLIAEEANECDPWFAYKDKDGIPEGIQWNTITTYMIAEMKKIRDDIARFEEEIVEIKNKL